MAPASGVDWGAAHFWFGDERFVDSDSEERNAVQARAAFLDAVGATRVHEVPAADQVADAEAAAASYGDLLRAEGSDAFDVLMLGVGPDGHIASLFPHHPGLDVTGTITAAVHDSPKPPPDRVTLTFEALERSHVVWFVVSGEGKADAVARALAADGSIADTPARGVKGMTETTWFLDHDAASRL
jgi:6-phosphogluconolactonase